MPSHQEYRRLLVEAEEELREEKIRLGLTHQALSSAEEAYNAAHERHHQASEATGRATQKVSDLKRAMLELQPVS